MTQNSTNQESSFVHNNLRFSQSGKNTSRSHTGSRIPPFQKTDQTMHHLTQFRVWYNDNGKKYKYVSITTNQPHTLILILPLNSTQ